MIASSMQASHLLLAAQNESPATPRGREILLEVLGRLGKRLGARIRNPRIADRSIRFDLELSGVHLRGLEDVACIFLMKETPELVEVVRSFLVEEAGPGRVPFLLCGSCGIAKLIEGMRGPAVALILQPEEVQWILEDRSPLQIVKRALWDQVPLRRLIRYSIGHPASGEIFYGRKRQLQEIQEREATSFAVTGPGRIGKTSLLLRYLELANRATGPGRREAAAFVTLYDCPYHGSEEVGWFVARKLGGSDPDEDLFALLERLAKEHGSPLTLLVDEVDAVCEVGGIDLLAEAARRGLCRLILSGREVLHRSVLGGGSRMAGRVTLIRLAALEEEDARSLLLRPLEDLGLTIEDPWRTVERVCKATGRLPHLLQVFGTRLAEMALDDERGCVTLRHLDRLAEDDEVGGYATQPLRDISRPDSRLLALTLLRHANGSRHTGPVRSGYGKTAALPTDNRSWHLSEIDEIAREAGISTDPIRLHEICQELMSCHILARAGDQYTVAYDGLRTYSSRLGILDVGSDRPLSTSGVTLAGTHF